jgi:N-acetylglucosamine kinase-like BadF-type ATPase
MGLMALRCAVRSYEHRSPLPTRLVELVSEHFALPGINFRKELVQLTYQKPLDRTEIAGLAPDVTGLALQGDEMALRITEKVANDLTALAVSTARQLFSPSEALDVVIAGGMIHAGDLLLLPLEKGFKEVFPLAVLRTGTQEPAVALGRLALFEIKEELC